VFPLGWPFETDPRWSWLLEVLRSFGALEAWDDQFRVADVTPAMRDAGFVAVEAAEIKCPLDFADREEWWSWAWSHGTRSLFEAVPSDRQMALRQAVFEGLLTCKQADGLIHGSMSALVVRATTPSN
jgi:hypothetical protein